MILIRVRNGDPDLGFGILDLGIFWILDVRFLIAEYFVICNLKFVIV